MTEFVAAARSVVEREMPHPPRRIWRALTQGPLIEEWLMKNDFQPVVGHAFNFRATPMPHWNNVVDGQVLVVEPNQRLSCSWNASGEEAADGRRSVVTWTLTPMKGGTHVRMEQAGFRPRTRPATGARATAGSGSLRAWSGCSPGKADDAACRRRARRGSSRHERAGGGRPPRRRRIARPQDRGGGTPGPGRIAGAQRRQRRRT